MDFEGQGVNNKTDGTVFGLLVRTKRGRPRPGIHVVASDARSARKKAWFAFLLNVWQVDRDGRAPIFHFGNYDRALMEGMLRLFGGPTSILSRFIDVHPIAARYSVIADRSTSAKAFAQALKLPVRHPAMRGRDAVALWDTWLETGEARHLRKLTEYNEDDLRALLTITDWLREPQRA